MSIENCLSAKFPSASQGSTLQAGFSTSRQFQTYCANSFPTEDFQENVLYKVKVIAFYSEYEISSERGICVFFNKLIYLMHASDTVETLNHNAQR